MMSMRSLMRQRIVVSIFRYDETGEAARDGDIISRLWLVLGRWRKNGGEVLAEKRVGGSGGEKEDEVIVGEEGLDLVDEVGVEVGEVDD